VSDPERDFWRGWFDPLWYGLIALVFLAMSCSLARGQSLARHAVVRVGVEMQGGRSTSGSATVIATAPGRTYLLSAAHVFSTPGRIKLDAPAPVSGPPVRDARPRVVALDRQADLALVVMDAGPLPYVCPVAPEGAAWSRSCLSVGYDDARLPPQYRPASVLSEDSSRIYTRERPWHGRSGGALIDERNGWLVGVVSGYTGPTAPSKAVFPEVHPSGHGIYGGHKAIVRMLRSQGLSPGGEPRGAPSPGESFAPPGTPYARPPCPT
jgi:hypothetical protein